MGTPLIGVVSSYPELTAEVKRWAAEEGVSVRVVEAVLEEGVEAARQLASEVLVLVSRGPTGYLIRRSLHAPVVLVEINAFDVLCALRRATELSERIAYVGFAYEKEDIDFGRIRELLGVPFLHLTYESLGELWSQLERARELGVGVVVGTGACIPPRAGRLGMTGVVVESSPVAVRQAMARAMEIARARQTDRARSRLLQTVIDHTGVGVLVTRADGRLALCNRVAERLLLLDKKEALGRLPRELDLPRRIVEILEGPAGYGFLCELRDTQLVVNKIAVEDQREGTPASAGCHVFTLQPVRKIQQLEQKIRRELAQKGLVARFTFEDVVGRSPLLKRVVQRARRYAAFDSTVLITGESGTGKELFAQSIHNASPRRQGPFVAVNCAALPENLLESELFGYEEGAFTGARRGGRVGLFELAHGGTIFLDEIGSITPALQARLLRVLQERCVMRLGGDRVIPVDVRVIAATNKSLSEMVGTGQFREDLYYRLDVLRLDLPPLRERREDVPVLAEFFAREATQRLGCPLPEIRPGTWELLASYDWPGNARELQNFIERLVILCSERPDRAEDLLRELLAEKQGDKGPVEEGERMVIRLGSLADIERQVMEYLRVRYGGNKSVVARVLGISRTTAWRRFNRGSSAH